SSMAVYGEGWYRCGEHGPFHGAARDPAARGRGRWEVACPRCGAEARVHAIPEQSDVQPRGTHANSKDFQERMTPDKGSELGIHAVALRYFLTFGPRQSLYNPYSGICSIFSTQILNRKAPVVYEDGRQTRDILCAPDVARACRIAFESPRAAGRVFN